MPVRAALPVKRSMSGHPRNVRISGGDDAKPDGMIDGRQDGLALGQSASEGKGAPLTGQKSPPLNFQNDKGGTWHVLPTFWGTRSSTRPCGNVVPHHTALKARSKAPRPPVALSLLSANLGESRSSRIHTGVRPSGEAARSRQCRHHTLRQSAKRSCRTVSNCECGRHERPGSFSPAPAADGSEHPVSPPARPAIRAPASLGKRPDFRSPRVSVQTTPRLRGALALCARADPGCGQRRDRGHKPAAPAGDFRS